MHLIHDVLDKQILDRHGRKLGRVDGLVIEIDDGGPPRIVGLETGVVALACRLGRGVLSLVPTGKRGGYRIPWNKLDLSDPLRPRLRCSVDELQALETDT